MATFDSWESYFHPETYDAASGSGTMRNLFGERNAERLRDREYAVTARRFRELGADRELLPRTYDAAHVAAIHGYLFQDVYEWAGKFRTVDISKAWPPEMGRGHSDFLERGRIHRYLNEVQIRVAGTGWASMNRDQFARAAADIFSRVNFAHPMREGNGRTTKMFMQHLAELSQFKLATTPERAGISAEQWNRASALTSPVPGTDRPVPDAMVPIFQRFAQPRAEHPRPLDIAGERARAARLSSQSAPSGGVAEGMSGVNALYRASFPNPVSSAVQRGSARDFGMRPYRPVKTPNNEMGGR